jgi:hypothetical protein
MSERIQLSISNELSKKLRKKADAYGFNSFNEAIRVFLTKIAADEIDLRFVQIPTVANNYQKSMTDINSQQATSAQIAAIEEARASYKEDEKLGNILTIPAEYDGSISELITNHSENIS